MFLDIKTAINWLETQPRFRPKTSLDYVKNAYDLLNINFDNIKKIHVAGTNGKGSTSAYITNILVNNDVKVGTFTSPYLVVFNERIRINNINISNEDLLTYINYFYDLNETIFNKYNYKLSFFEIVTLISFKYFYDNNVDAIVIEVGIGGRLDATNILNYDVSIITSIGLDHMQQLGNSLEEIASEKLGILKENGYLISCVNNDLKDLMIDYANNVNAKYLFIDTNNIVNIDNNTFKYLNNEFKISLLGDYQKNNALLAYSAIKYLYNLNDIDIIEPLSNTKWEGRLEEIVKDVYIDGAHNIPAIEALMSNISKLFSNKKITVLFSALKDKEIQLMLDIISRYNYKTILTSFPDFRFQELSQFESSNVIYIEDSIKTLNCLIKNKEEDEVIIVTGSLHFIGYIKQNL